MNSTPNTPAHRLVVNTGAELIVDGRIMIRISLDGIDWTAAAVEVYEEVEGRVYDFNPNIDPDTAADFINGIVLERLA